MRKSSALFLVLLLGLASAEVVGVSSEPFSALENGYIQVNLKNAATCPSDPKTCSESFTVYAQCSSGFSQIGSSKRTPVLLPGQEYTTYIPISGSCPSSDLTGTCTVTVAGRGSTDSQQVKVNCRTVRGCVHGQQMCDAKNIETCVNGAWVTTKTCGYACETKTGIPFCLNEPPTKTENLFPIYTVWVIIGAIFVALIYLIMKKRK